MFWKIIILGIVIYLLVIYSREREDRNVEKVVQTFFCQEKEPKSKQPKRENRFF
jgi:hypothetical protein